MASNTLDETTRLPLVGPEDILTSTALEFGETGRELWTHYAHTNPILARELLARALVSVSTLTSELVPQVEDLEVARVIVNQALFAITALEVAARRIENDESTQHTDYGVQLVLFETATATNPAASSAVAA